MAFEELNDYSVALYTEYKKLEGFLEITAERKVILVEQKAVFNCMVRYYTTVLCKAKFKSQREKMKEIITELDPGFAKGFFKTK